MSKAMKFGVRIPKVEAKTKKIMDLRVTSSHLTAAVIALKMPGS